MVSSHDLYYYIHSQPITLFLFALYGWHNPSLLLVPWSSPSSISSTPSLSLPTSLSLSHPLEASLAGHGVAAVRVPLHVTHTPHGLHLGAASTIFIKVLVVTLLQQVLAATVAWVLVAHPAEGGKQRRGDSMKGRKK